MKASISTYQHRGGVSRAFLQLLFATLLMFSLCVPLAAQTASESTAPAEQESATAPEGGTGSASAKSGSAARAASDPISYEELAQTLEDPAERDKLIAQLRTLAQAQSAGDPVERKDTGPELDLELPSGIAVLSQRLGGSLQEVTAQLSDDIQQTFRAFSRIGSSRGVTEGKLEAWLPALRVLAIVVAATLLAYVLLRGVASLLFGRLNTWIRTQPVLDPAVRTGPSPAAAAAGRAGLTTVPFDEASALEASRGEETPLPTPLASSTSAGSPPADSPSAAQHHAPHTPHRHRLKRLTLSRKLLGVVLALVVDVGATLLAALAGYVVAAALADRAWSSGTFAFQFLTAFVLIEVVKSISRAVFATRYEHLRLLPMHPETAAYWNRWITLLIALTGYCLLVVVPVGQAVLAPSIGRLIGLVIMLCVYVTALRVVWSQKLAVRAALMQYADTMEMAVFGTLLRTLARVWHWLAFAYFTVLLIASQAEQAAALAFMVSATVQSLLAIVVGALISAALVRLESRHLSLPENWNRNFPLLERRVNGYKDPALRGIRLAVIVLAFLVVLDAWRAFDLAAWLDSERGRATVALVVRVGIVLASAALAWTILASVIEHRVGAREGRRASEREKTLLMLFRNAAAIVIVTMTVLVVLSQIGIDIGPLIAGAGVVGLAIGFGAQKLVQDVITGVFIQLENGMNQNDIVEVAGHFGTVEKITVRSVVIRTLDGGYHLIPFSAIDTVSNHTRDFGYHFAEYNIAHREDIDQAVAELEAAFKELMTVPELAAEVLENIEIPGVTALNERGFSVRVLIKTRPGSQWMIQRAFNRLVKQRFDAAGIEIPYPHTVIHFGRDRDGQAAPVDFRAVDAIKEKVQSGQAQGGESSQAPQPEGPPVGAAGTAPTEAVEPRAPDIQQKAMEGIAREEEAVREGELGRAPGPDAEAGGSGSRSRRSGRGRRRKPGPGSTTT